MKPLAAFGAYVGLAVFALGYGAVAWVCFLVMGAAGCVHDKGVGCISDVECQSVYGPHSECFSGTCDYSPQEKTASTIQH